MSNKNAIENYLCCKICNKEYASRSSLCNHNKKFHKKLVNKVTIPVSTPEKNVNIITQNNENINDDISLKKHKCKLCSKLFRCRQGKYQHEKKCKQKINEEKTKEIKLKELDIIKIEKETELIKLKLKIKNQKKLNSTTFNSLNKMLMNRNYVNNSHNNNTTNIQNNNIQLISFGKNEHLADYLSNKDKKSIILSANKCIEKLIDISYNGPYNQFKNIIITNLKDNFVYKYDEKKGYFVAANKNDTLKEFIDTRVMDIEEIYNKLSDAKKIDENTKNTIEKFLEKIQNYNEKFVDNTDNITYPSYRDYKINKIKILLYNNHDKVSKDLALYFLPEDDNDYILD